MRFMLLLMLAVLSGCTVKTTSIHHSPTPDIQLTQVTSATDSYVGQQVRWGGMVAEVRNLEQQSELTLVQFPLTRYGNPITTGRSVGRFVVTTKSFLDPLIYQEGVLVTVVGTIEDVITRQIDQKSLPIPVVNMTDSQVWPDKYGDRLYPYNPKHDAPFRGYGYYGTGSYSP